MSRSINRRELIEIGAKVGAIAAGGALLGNRLLQPAAALDSTPEAVAFPPADLPVIDITIGADGSITAPAEAAAGTNVVRVTAPEDGAHVSLSFVLKPEEIGDEEFAAAFETENIPEWLHNSPVTGSVDLEPAMQGPVGQVVTDLTAGTWQIVNLGETTTFSSIEITGDPVLVDLEAAVSVELQHHDFTMPSEVPAGDQVWKVTNIDHVLHHMILFATETLLTDEEMLAALMADPMASPEAGAPAPPMVMPVGGTGVLSNGQHIYQLMSLAPGTYTALCFIADPGEDQPPHAMLGMIESFTAV